MPILKKLLTGIKSIFSCSKYVSKLLKITRFHRGIGRTPSEALFGGKPGAGLVSMNLGKLKDGVSAEDQLLEVLGDNNNKEEESAEEVEATMVEARVTLDRADNNDNADNARLNIIFSCDNDECQTLEELEAHKNSHLDEVGPEEANSCSPCKRRFKCAYALMDHIKLYHETCAECVKHGVICALCRQEERMAATY